MFTVLLSPLIVPSILILGIFFILLRSIIRAALDPLRHLPGPRWSRFSRIWYLSHVWDGHFEKTNIKLHRELGPIVRIAPNQYSIDDPEAIKVIYGHGTKFIKAAWYRASGDKNIHNLFTDSNPQRHAENRRKVAGLYSMTALAHFEPHIEQCTDLLVARMNEFAQSRQSFDVQQWLQCYAFDVIGLMTCNKRFGFLDSGKDIRGIFRTIHSYLVYTSNVGVYSEFHDIISALKKWLLPEDVSGGILSFVQQELRERLNSNDLENSGKLDTGDFLTTVLKLHENDPDKFPMMNVMTTCLQNIGAGSDTTSVSLASIVYNLAKYPDKLLKLRQELDTAIKKGAASTPITFQQAHSLPYLQACIKEGLRLHPATGLPLVRVVPQEGATIARTFFPAGTTVGINTWVAHYNQSVFGLDADMFRPERWLQSKEKTSQMDQYYFPFGLGSRTCIGKNISLIEISKLIPELFRQFNFTLVHPDNLETENVWFVIQTNLKCTVKLRDQSAVG